MDRVAATRACCKPAFTPKLHATGCRDKRRRRGGRKMMSGLNVPFSQTRQRTSSFWLSLWSQGYVSSAKRSTIQVLVQDMQLYSYSWKKKYLILSSSFSSKETQRKRHIKWAPIFLREFDKKKFLLKNRSKESKESRYIVAWLQPCNGPVSFSTSSSSSLIS